mgnify:FL=1
MNEKKTNKANLDNRIGIFTQIGLIVSLSAVLFAFEWRSYETRDINLPPNPTSYIDDDWVDITPQAPDPPLPPPPNPQFQISEDPGTQEDLSLFNPEIDPSAPIDLPPPPPPKPAEPTEDIHEPEYYISAEVMPTFPGGEEALIRYLISSIKYPSQAREANIQGIVYVDFIVEKDGSISNVSIRRGIGGGCDEEAVRVVKNMPSWSPGYQRTQPVRVQFNVPIKFTLK